MLNTRSAATFAALAATAFAVPASAFGQEKSVVSGPLQRSDVLLSPRFYRPNWLDALQSFSANRIVWTYGGEKLVGEAAPYGIPVQCTIPFWVPRDDPRKDEMACVNPEGTPVSLAPTLVFPDVNTDAWRRYVLSEAERLVDAGCTSFQQDGAWLNYQNAIWRNGCFGIGVEGLDDPSGSAASSEAAFQEFQKESTAEYHAWLHDSIEAYAESRTPGLDVTFSGNFAYSLLRNGKSNWLLPQFDFVLSEAFGTRATMPEVLRGIAHEMDLSAAVSGVTTPSNDVWLNQRSIASAYALGLTAIVPWDVHVRGGGPRFFAYPGDFSPLLQMVRSTPSLFDDYASEQDFYGEYGPVLPGQGTVTKVDRSAPGRTAVSWSRGASFQEVALGRQIVVGGVKYKTIVPSHVGLIYLPGDAGVSVGDPFYFRADPDSYLISVRRNMHEPERRAVHVVSWGQKPVSLFLHLRRSEFPAPPTRLVTPANPDPTPIEPQVAGNYYVYAVGNPVWAILY